MLTVHGSKVTRRGRWSEIVGGIQGSIIAGFTVTVKASSVPELETLAVKGALSTLKEEIELQVQSLLHVELQTNSLSVLLVSPLFSVARGPSVTFLRDATLRWSNYKTQRWSIPHESPTKCLIGWRRPTEMMGPSHQIGPLCPPNPYGTCFCFESLSFDSCSSSLQ